MPRIERRKEGHQRELAGGAEHIDDEIRRGKRHVEGVGAPREAEFCRDARLDQDSRQAAQEGENAHDQGTSQYLAPGSHV